MDFFLSMISPAMEATMEMPPLVVYGVMARLLGVVYCVALGSWFLQAPATFGPDGAYPAGKVVADAARKMPLGLRLWAFAPSLFTLNSSLWFMRLVFAAGIVCGVIVAIGTQYSRVCFAFLFVVMHTVHDGLPWDTLISEMGFLAIFLPALRCVDTSDGFTSLGVASMPSALLRFAFRWLCFRLMFGFGKTKFVGSKTLTYDSLYNKNFFVTQPIPSPVAWFGYHLLPDPFHRVTLVFLWLAEIVSPFFMFPTGWYRAFGAATTIGLMLMIQGGGNFGYFNILTVVLAVSLFDVHDSVTAHFSLSDAASLDRLDGLLFSLYFLYMCMVVLPFMAVNSWGTHGFPYWPTWNKAPRVLAAFGKMCRILHPWRIVNGYGVFPPATLAPNRFVIVFEGSTDGVTWKKWTYKFLPSQQDSKPVMVAPHHPRLDHLMYYEGPGTFPMSAIDFFIGVPVASKFGVFNIMGCLLRGCRNPVYDLFANNPFPDPDTPPRWVRVSLNLLNVRPVADAKQGLYWEETPAGLHFPAKSLETISALTSSAIPWAEDTPADSVILRGMGLKMSPVTTEAYEAGWDLLDRMRECAAASAGEPDLPPVTDPISFDTAERVFTWKTLQDVNRMMRTDMTMASLLEARTAIKVMACVLAAKLERVYVRLMPSKEELQAEIEAAKAMPPRQGAQWAEWEAAYMELPELTAQSGTMGDDPGPMGTCFDSFIQAYHLLLCGGRKRYEAVVDTSMFLNKSVACTDRSNDPVAAVFRDTNVDDLNIRRLDFQVRGFLYVALDYDIVVRDIAKRFLRVSLFPTKDDGDPGWMVSQSGGVMPGVLRALDTAPLLPAWDEVTQDYVPFLKALPRWQVNSRGVITLVKSD